MDYEALCKRYDALKGNRGTWESHWQEVAEFCFPRRADFNVQRTEGDKRDQRAIDPAARTGLYYLAAGLHGFASNPASRWFALRTGNPVLDEDDSVREWLGDVEDIIFSRMHSPRSSITTHLHELYLDMGAFGTGVMFIGVGKEDNLLFQTRFLGECVIDENAEGAVDTVIRCFKMSVRQMVQRWGSKVSEDVRKKHADDKLDEMIEVLHAVYPREDRDMHKETPDNMPWASVYIEKKEKHELQVGGFEEFPYAVPRWYKTAGEKYGRSPAMDALSEVKMLQEMRKTMLKAAQKVVDPPLMVPDDGVVGPVRTVPGGLNYVRGDGEIRPLVTGANIPISIEVIQDSRRIIEKIFFTDIMQPAIEKQVTAYEYAKIVEQAMRLLGPVIGRMQAELLGPLITRVFGILARSGELPPQPEALDGVEFHVEYTSPMALAQRAAKVDYAVQMLTIVGQMSAFDPSIMSRFNSEEFLTWMANEMNVDAELILNDEEFAQKQQAMQLQNMVAPAQMAADAFAKAGQGAKSFAEAQAVTNA